MLAKPNNAKKSASTIGKSLGVVGSHPCSDDFSAGSPVFLSTRKPPKLNTLAKFHFGFDARIIYQVFFLPRE